MIGMDCPCPTGSTTAGTRVMYGYFNNGSIFIPPFTRNLFVVSLAGSPTMKD